MREMANLEHNHARRGRHLLYRNDPRTDVDCTLHLGLSSTIRSPPKEPGPSLELSLSLSQTQQDLERENKDIESCSTGKIDLTLRLRSKYDAVPKGSKKALNNSAALTKHHNPSVAITKRRVDGGSSTKTIQKLEGKHGNKSLRNQDSKPVIILDDDDDDNNHGSRHDLIHSKHATDSPPQPVSSMTNMEGHHATTVLESITERVSHEGRAMGNYQNQLANVMDYECEYDGWCMQIDREIITLGAYRRALFRDKSCLMKRIGHRHTH